MYPTLIFILVVVYRSKKMKLIMVEESIAIVPPSHVMNVMQISVVIQLKNLVELCTKLIQMFSLEKIQM